MDDGHAALAQAGTCALASIEVVLTSLARQNLAILGDFETLQV